MLRIYVRVRCLMRDVLDRMVHRAAAVLAREAGQTTAEYALVILAAAAVAIVLIGWARSTGKLPAFFDQIIDNISGTQ